MNDNGKKVGFFEIISSGDFIEEEIIQKKGKKKKRNIMIKEI